MEENESYELINNKDDTCDNCVFARTDCPQWAISECTSSNKIWVAKKDNSTELTTGQAAVIFTCGCLITIVLTILMIIANAFAVGYILHKFFNG